MKKTIISVFIVSQIMFLSGCGKQLTEKELTCFINEHVQEIAPLDKEAKLANWDASVTGRADDFERLRALRHKISKIYADSNKFTFLKRMKESGCVPDPKLIRQLDKLYAGYLSSQVPQYLTTQIVELDTQVQEKYNIYRGNIDGKKITNTEIYHILTTEKDSVIREKAWRASKQVGDVIVEDLVKLVKLRNKSAKKTGFDNYHTLSLWLNEQDVEQIDAIFEELERLTREPYRQIKSELDAILAADYGISTEQLKPWHYHDPFFQRGPLVYALDLDAYYEKADVRYIAEKYYEGIGLSVKDILARSDLYDKEGKFPHAFSEDLDRQGDVRILCNLDNTERWMETILHELGHAVYSKYHDPAEPYLLREPAHAFTTEAVAMFFGRLSRNAAWMQKMLDLTDQQRIEIETVTAKYLKVQQLIFARWAMVMYNFEKELYANPDQDLNGLWWDLVEKYQFVQRPPGPLDSGWASKLHFTIAPCYYHNYMLGELLASQWHNYIVKNILKTDSDENVSYVDCPEVGFYFKKNVLGPGAVFHWNEMIKKSTSQELTPKYFVEQFVN